MNEMDIDKFEAFEENYRSAKMYHFRAKQFLDEGQHFSVVFNVASVALENYLIALCWLYKVEPGNHNYTCLMDSLEEGVQISPALNREIRSMDSIFGICSLDNYYHGMPEQTDMNLVLAICNAVQKLFDPAKISAIRSDIEKYKDAFASKD
ncbi:MAG: hypothetical protein P4N41_16805 [Negativicutes bacterium]|nr:hypothetical protein [Negativicutes bacterium]